MIKHTVTFKIKPNISAAEIKSFFNAAGKLKNIPGVNDFECLKRIGAERGFAIFMKFENSEVHQAYNKHPIHESFIQQYWLVYVEVFEEADFEILI